MIFSFRFGSFVYFFGGGLTGLKGYTYYEPTLQGPELFMLNNEVSIKIFSDKSYGLEIFSLWLQASRRWHGGYNVTTKRQMYSFGDETNEAI